MCIVDGVVVLYNPTKEVVDNVLTYAPFVRRLYVVDNSTQKQKLVIQPLSMLENVEYIDALGNQGIAKALNIGAESAISNNADWLLTMDQDSAFPDGAVIALLNQLQTLDSRDQLGILSAMHAVDGIVFSGEVYALGMISQETVMTSGNLLSMKAYKEVGPFAERYFIDCVDHEYCLRLKKHGFMILMSQIAMLTHTLGKPNSFSFMGKTVYYTNHSVTRRYYMTRNRLDMCFKYFLAAPQFVIIEVRYMFIEWMKILLFERDKAKKFYAVLKGIGHFCIRRFGKL